jgi:hypothetical protein
VYNTKLIRQQGGSELSFASGASLTFATGAQLSGAIGGTPTFSEGVNQSGGSDVYNSGTLVTYQAGACMSFNLTGPSQTTFKFINGTSTPAILMGSDKPTVNAPMGSLYIRSGGSMSTLYINTTQDASGSTWLSFNRTSAVA